MKRCLLSILLILLCTSAMAYTQIIEQELKYEIESNSTHYKVQIFTGNNTLIHSNTYSVNTNVADLFKYDVKIDIGENDFDCGNTELVIPEISCSPVLNTAECPAMPEISIPQCPVCPSNNFTCDPTTIVEKEQPLEPKDNDALVYGLIAILILIVGLILKFSDDIHEKLLGSPKKKAHTEPLYQQPQDYNFYHQRVTQPLPKPKPIVHKGNKEQIDNSIEELRNEGHSVNGNFKIESPPPLTENSLNDIYKRL